MSEANDAKKAKLITLGGQVAGLALAGAVGAGLAILANAVYRGGADAGDWLQFFGGVLGAALAVFGAVYFEKRRRSLTGQKERALLRELLLDLHGNLRRLVVEQEPLKPGSDQPTRAANMLVMNFKELAMAHDFVPEVRRWADIEDYASISFFIDFRRELRDRVPGMRDDARRFFDVGWKVGELDLVLQRRWMDLLIIGTALEDLLGALGERLPEGKRFDELSTSPEIIEVPEVDLTSLKARALVGLGRLLERFRL